MNSFVDWIPIECARYGPYYNKNEEIILYYRRRGLADHEIAYLLGISEIELCELCPPLSREMQEEVSAWRNEENMRKMQEIIIKGDSVGRDAREFAKHLQEELGECAYYSKSPYYAYRIGNIFIDRVGNLLVLPEYTDTAILMKLVEEKWIGQINIVRCKNILLCCTGEYIEEKLEESEEPEEAKGRIQDKEEDTIPIEMDKETYDILTFPLSEHNGSTLRNLFRMIYNKSELINKATDGNFYIEEGLIQALREDACTYSIANFMHAVTSYEAINGPSYRGIKFAEDKVVFNGFPVAENEMHLAAFAVLALMMNRTAIRNRRIIERQTPMENEKYEMHQWLFHLGMGGAEYKELRKILKRNLSGSSMGKTKDAQERNHG